MVDIYRDAKRRGIYPPLFTLEVEICLMFSNYRISLLHLNSRLGQLKNDVTTELKKLEAKVDFFNSR